MIISNYSYEKEQNWSFFGLIDDKFEHFQKGKDYKAFMIALKSEKLELYLQYEIERLKYPIFKER